MENKKGQAALEFLTTYGWAFLVILVMIGALAYFGVLNPGSMLPNRCTLGAEFTCADYRVSTSSPFINLKLKNNVGSPIVITGIDITTEGGVAITNCNIASSTDIIPIGNFTVKQNAVAGCGTDLVSGTVGGLTKGEKGKLFLTIKYYNAGSGSNFEKQSKGEILTIVG